MSDLARVLVDEIADDAAALERLRGLVGESTSNHNANLSASAFTVRTLAAELGRTERSIRAAITRGELLAVRRGRGWLIGAEAVAAWARSERNPALPNSRSPRPRKRVRSGPGPATRALRRLQS